MPKKSTAAKIPAPPLRAVRATPQPAWNTLPEPQTAFGRRLMAIRRQMAEEGIPFLSDDELDREIEARKGRRLER